MGLGIRFESFYLANVPCFIACIGVMFSIPGISICPGTATRSGGYTADTIRGLALFFLLSGTAKTLTCLINYLINKIYLITNLVNTNNLSNSKVYNQRLVVM